MEQKEYFKQWQEQNREKVRAYNKKWYEKNKEKVIERTKEYNDQTKDIRNARYRAKRDKDPVFKLKTNVRRSILKAFQSKGKVKKDRSLTILGCSIEDFKKHIESKFEPWMNWKNHGVYIKGKKESGWDLDHIIPISSAKSEGDIVKLNHYTNFQPLCSNINRYIKKDNYVSIF